MNYGFVMKWNPSGKNLQGQVNVVFRKLVDGVVRIYQIKSNAINSLAVANVNDNGQPATGNAVTFRRANISTKANLRDITDPLNPISLGGNLTFDMTAWESTTVNTGALDRISIQLSGNGNTGLLFSSKWSGTATIWQTLNGGKIQVRNATVPNNPKDGPAADQSPLPGRFELQQNYPNPFNPSTNIGFRLAEHASVRLSVYNALGREVAVLADGNYETGSYVARWDGADASQDLPTGLYTYRLHLRWADGSESQETKQMVLMK